MYKRQRGSWPKKGSLKSLRCSLSPHSKTPTRYEIPDVLSFSITDHDALSSRLAPPTHLPGISLKTVFGIRAKNQSRIWAEKGDTRGDIPCEEVDVPPPLSARQQGSVDRLTTSKKQYTKHKRSRSLLLAAFNNSPTSIRCKRGNKTISAGLSYSRTTSIVPGRLLRQCRDAHTEILTRVQIEFFRKRKAVSLDDDTGRPGFSHQSENKLQKH